jgi:ADP-ribose pyrophosphatase
MTSKKIFKARRFDIEEVHQKLEDGTTLARHVIRHPGAVVILPIVDDQHVCLIRTYRVAVERWLWELPAGTLDKGLLPFETATLELKEETGYEAKRLEHVHTFRMSPGILDEQMHFFVAQDLIAKEPEREVGEQIVNHILDWSSIDRMLRDGHIEDAKTLIALLWYMRYRTHA